MIYQITATGSVLAPLKKSEHNLKYYFAACASTALDIIAKDYYNNDYFVSKVATEAALRDICKDLINYPCRHTFDVDDAHFKKTTGISSILFIKDGTIMSDYSRLGAQSQPGHQQHTESINIVLEQITRKILTPACEKLIYWGWQG